jgi:hypothetical protein
MNSVVFITVEVSNLVYFRRVLEGAFIYFISKQMS